MKRIAAIKTFFETDDGRKVTAAEFKALSPEERDDLAELAADALGETLDEQTTEAAA
jgi:hypothetical protein